MTRARGSVGLALCLALLAGCAPATPVRRGPMTAARLLAEAKGEGLTLEDPLALDDEIIGKVKRVLSNRNAPETRLRRLVDYLNDEGYLHFAYTPNRSLTARQAFHERRGDCMAFSLLFVALARRLGLDAYFVHVTDVRDYYERGGWFFVSSHVAVGLGTGPNARVIDFTKEIGDWKLALYEAIDDGAAIALYYNNVAVDLMTARKYAEAERLFQFLLEREPSVVELYNNLGVLQNRMGRHDEALRVLYRGVLRFPSYEPLYTNAIRAARGLGREDLVSWYERRGLEISQRDPYFLFARAVTLYEQQRFGQAAQLFARASEQKPDSPVILAWLARSSLSAGKTQQGADAFQRAKKLDPGHSLLDALRREHPELEAPASQRE
jgi:Flp pilus assembly protein TadD